MKATDVSEGMGQMNDPPKDPIPRGRGEVLAEEGSVLDGPEEGEVQPHLRDRQGPVHLTGPQRRGCPLAPRDRWEGGGAAKGRTGRHNAVLNFLKHRILPSRDAKKSGRF